MADEISKPHDHLFRSVFEEGQEREAGGLPQRIVGVYCDHDAGTRELAETRGGGTTTGAGGRDLMNKTEKMIEIYGELSLEFLA